METKIWGNPGKARILVIGHDPGLQKSSTIAEYCFFADYYFRPKPSKRNELAKYQLAEAVFNCIRDLTTGQFRDEEILIMNLCNETLIPSPPNKINYIPEEEAEEGLNVIRELLQGSSIKLIFAMAQQVNYWLQKLGFYQTDTTFLEKSVPKSIGVESEQPYYQPCKTGAFKEICGNKYMADKRYFLFPILHVKSYPLRGNFRIYEDNYEQCKKQVSELVDSLKVRNEL